MRPPRSITRAFEFLTRSRVAWIAFTIVVLSDLYAWTVPKLSTRRTRCYWPAVEIVVFPPDATGTRTFADSDQTGVTWDDAD